MIAPPLISPSNGLADWSLDSALRRHVAAVLEYTEGDLAWAAAELRVNVSTLYRWRKAWDEGRAARVARKGVQLVEVACAS